MLQALHEGPAMWRQLHQHKEALQERAGVRMLKSIQLLLAIGTLTLTPVASSIGQVSQINVERGIANYRAVQSGAKRLDQLTPQERSEVAAVARVLSRPRAPRETSECRDAWDRASSAADDVARGATRLKNCVEAGDFRDDCYSASRTVRSAHSDYESAVSQVNSECR